MLPSSIAQKAKDRELILFTILGDMVFFPFTINKSKIGFRDNKHRVYSFKEKEASPPTFF